jgi:hypothetical protein
MSRAKLLQNELIAHTVDDLAVSRRLLYHVPNAAFRVSGEALNEWRHDFINAGGKGDRTRNQSLRLALRLCFLRHARSK